MLRLTFIMVFICGIGYAQDSDPNFRDASWGMSKSEVKKNEEKDIDIELSGTLRYIDNIIGMYAKVYYLFTDNKLTRGKYIFDEDPPNPQDHISDFKKTKRLLKKKYGTPQTEGPFWTSELAYYLYEDNRDDWGTALISGKLFFRCTFKIEKTEIIAYLENSYGKKVRHGITYRSLKYKDEREEKEEKEYMDDL